MRRPVVLIGYSTCQVTREAFERAGCLAYTCDLLTANSQYHIQADIWEVLESRRWSFAVLHPMCTYLTVSAAWAYKDGPYHQKVKPTTLVGLARRKAQAEALGNFRKLLALPFPVAVENPSPSYVATQIRRPDQTIQPYHFGDNASKGTGLWLTRGVPLLTRTRYCPPRIVWHAGKLVQRWDNQTNSGQNRCTPSEERWLERSATYPGIADAMGDQWGRWLTQHQRSNT